MNFQQVKTINGVKSFEAMENGELILKGDALYLGEKLIKRGVETFSWYDNRVICVMGDITLLLERNGMEFISRYQIDKAIIYQSISNNNAVFTSELNLDDFTLKYEIIDFDTKATVFEFGRLPLYGGIYRYSNIIFLYHENQLTCFNISDKQIKWGVRLETSKIEKIVDVWENQLIIACRDHLLLSIDINTGETIHKWQELKGFEAGQFYKDVLPEPTNFVLDKYGAKLIGVFDTYYFEIDLVSKEINYYQLKDELSKYGIGDFRPFNNNPFTSDHLFVTAHTYLAEIPNVDLSSVLALNRKTKKVDWVHIFKDTGLGTNVPQITSTHLYQLDTENTLHIFEKVSRI